jgi:hypothetical protein
MENVNVFCRSETDYAERPTSFEWQGRCLRVAQLLQRWRSPRELGFRVMTDDDQIFEVYYDLQNDSWRVDQR